MLSWLERKDVVVCLLATGCSRFGRIEEGSCRVFCRTRLRGADDICG